MSSIGLVKFLLYELPVLQGYKCTLLVLLSKMFLDLSVLLIHINLELVRICFELSKAGLNLEYGLVLLVNSCLLHLKSVLFALLLFSRRRNICILRLEARRPHFIIRSHNS